MTLALRPSPPDRPPPLADRFRALFEAQVDYVTHSLRRLGVRPGDTEDVAHEVFLTVHQHLDAYDPARPLRPWLFGIAFRAASNYRRRASFRRETLDEADEPVSPAPLADSQIEDAERRLLLERALDTLDLDRRAVLVLHDLDEQPMPLVAEALAIPLNTAYSRLRLAREDLRARLLRPLRGRA